jgi:luciferase family oxidoreductase group 1
MLPHYSPLKVAESFSLLSGLFPRRIDLALGRAPGTDSLTMFALQRDRRERAPDDFPEQLAELLGYLRDDLPPDHPFARLGSTLPGRPEAPDPWLLGSSPQSGIWAAERGLPYAFADFINPAGAEIAARYVRSFTPGSRGIAPRIIVCAWVLCADTDEEAERLTASHRMLMTLLHQGQSIAVPPVEKALRFLANHAEASRPASTLPIAFSRKRRAIVGAPATVRRGIEDVAREYGTEEVMIVTITHDPEARRRSYELVADAFGMSARPEDRAATFATDAA